MPEFPPSPIAAAARAFMVALDDQTGEPEETEEAAIEWVALNYHINQSEVELALAVAMLAYAQALAAPVVCGGVAGFGAPGCTCGEHPPRGLPSPHCPMHGSRCG